MVAAPLKAPVNPLTGLTSGLMSALVRLFQVNTPTPPRNPIGGFLWGVFRSLDRALGFVPVAGTPTVGTPDPVTGAVTGTWAFTVPAGLPMTYIFAQAASGVVHVYTNGTFSYTPAEAARVLATPTTTDMFSITASDGAASTVQFITVPVLQLDKPVAGIPTVGKPDPVTGVVIGNLNFTDPAGKPLSYSVTTKPGQGSVDVSPTGDYTYTPTPEARQAAGLSVTAVIDSFTVTASNGLASTDESVSVTVSPINPAPGTVIGTIAGLAGLGPTNIWLNPNGSRLYVETSSRGLYVVNTATNTVGGPLDSRIASSNPTYLTFSPDGSRIYAAHGGQLVVVNAADNTVIKTVSVAASNAGTVITKDGKYVYTVGDASQTDGVITEFDTATGTTAKITFSLVPSDGYAPLTSVAISPNGQNLYVVSAYSGTIYAIDLAASTYISKTIDYGSSGHFGPGQLAVSPDGSRVYIPSATNSVPNPLMVFDTATNTVVARISLDNRQFISDPASQVQLSDDGTRVYVLSSGLIGQGVFGRLSVVDATDNSVLRTILYNGFPSTFAVTADGRFAYVQGSVVGGSNPGNTVSLIAL
ncbi:VCBS domain-containing protein [Mycobacterium sp. RTGN5]|uniref:YncE family protein n=1 Tax=Mycobacterium sp. RTGN5 TaxID=3016522 RepID=UPI0029C6933D|nr:VCBS domain-containing protein [Mycobacterium sp. RTGN5]